MSIRISSSRLIRSAASSTTTSSRQVIPSLVPRHASTSAKSSPLEEKIQTSSPAPGPPKPNSPFTIFDRQAKSLQRSRAARRRATAASTTDEEASSSSTSNEPGSASRQADYVRMIAAENVAERILDIKRPFETIVEIGSGPGYLRRHLDAEGTGCKKLIMCDSNREMLYRDEHLDKHFPFEIERRVMDEEELDFEQNSLDCVVSSGSLHWTNDLPGTLIQIQRSLKPDGAFIGAMYGGETLFELRTSLQLAEQEREGGISPRVSPMTDTRDCASLLSRAGFNIPTVDIDEVTVTYPSIYELMHDLRDMGESNAVINRRPLLRRDTLLSAGAIYEALHSMEDGTLPATFGIIYMIGWKPDPSQAKPLERGSATTSMKDILGDSSDLSGGSGGIGGVGGGGQTRSYSTSSKAPASTHGDYYTLMDLDFNTIPQKGWAVDPSALKASWRRAQALSHPDRMYGKTEEEQKISAIQSSLLNKAYETLLDPLSRAHYLIERVGLEVPQESDSLEDPELLMEVMDLRESLEEAESEEEVEGIALANQEHYDRAVKELGECFEKEDYERARRVVTELRYWSNIRKVCKEWQPGQRIELSH